MRAALLMVTAFVFMATMVSQVPAATDSMGRYGDIAASTTSLSEITSLVDFVMEARDYARSVERGTAFGEFDNKTGRFVNGQLYIYAYDLNGTTLALPFQPKLVGKSRLVAEDSNGVRFIQNLIDQAKRGLGYAYYLLP